MYKNNLLDAINFVSTLTCYVGSWFKIIVNLYEPHYTLNKTILKTIVI